MPDQSRVRSGYTVSGNVRPFVYLPYLLLAIAIPTPQFCRRWHTNYSLFHGASGCLDLEGKPSFKKGQVMDEVNFCEVCQCVTERCDYCKTCLECARRTNSPPYGNLVLFLLRLHGRRLTKGCSLGASQKVGYATKPHPLDCLGLIVAKCIALRPLPFRPAVPLTETRARRRTNLVR
jgi:hypothetical protein